MQSGSTNESSEVFDVFIPIPHLHVIFSDVSDPSRYRCFIKHIRALPYKNSKINNQVRSDVPISLRIHSKMQSFTVLDLEHMYRLDNRF